MLDMLHSGVCGNWCYTLVATTVNQVPVVAPVGRCNRPAATSPGTLVNYPARIIRQ